jgi:hypothetical protein
MHIWDMHCDSRRVYKSDNPTRVKLGFDTGAKLRFQSYQNSRKGSSSVQGPKTILDTERFRRRTAEIKYPSNTFRRRSPGILRRSHRSRRSSIHHEASHKLRRRSTDARVETSSTSYQEPSFSIREFHASYGFQPQLLTNPDAEYAVHDLPLLVALMRSGHVKRGDAIDLLIPQPSSWRDTMAYIYTGSGAVTSCMRSNVLRLAENV